MKYQVKNIKLAEQGRLKIAWAEREMPAVANIAKDFSRTRPFKNIRIAACLHITKETAVLLQALAAGGARIAACGSNPLSTQDDVAAALAAAGVNIFAWKGQSNKDYYRCLNTALDCEPLLTIDDGADLVSLIHSKRKELLRTVWAGQEETTTGVLRLKAMAKDGALKYPVVAVNDTPTKRMFDNYYGTGQSTVDALMRVANILLAGKVVVVAGYGYCGKGIALRARGLGARVLVTEVGSLPALQAAMDGFEVMPMPAAAKLGDVFLTATGNRDVIAKDQVKLMKDGAILGNSGHFNVEINLADLQRAAKAKRVMREGLEEFTFADGRRIYLIAEGRLMNLAAAEGHPSAVMDMSFAGQALTCQWLAKNHNKLEAEVYDVPAEIDEKVSRLKLESLGVKIDKLTPEQKKYLSSWQEGT